MVFIKAIQSLIVVEVVVSLAFLSFVIFVTLCFPNTTTTTTTTTSKVKIVFIFCDQLIA